MTRQTRTAALIACAVVLVVCAVMREWFSTSGVSIGLWGIEVCTNGCVGMRWDDTGADLDIYAPGYIALVAALIGAVLTMICALRPDRSLVGPARTALTVAAIAMVAFFARLWVFDGMPGLSPSFALFFGPAAALTARWLLGTTDRR